MHTTVNTYGEANTADKFIPFVFSHKSQKRLKCLLPAHYLHNSDHLSQMRCILH